MNEMTINTPQELCEQLTLALKGVAKEYGWISQINEALQKLDKRFYTSWGDNSRNDFCIRYTTDENGIHAYPRYDDVDVCAVKIHCKKQRVQTGRYSSKEVLIADYFSTEDTENFDVRRERVLSARQKAKDAEQEREEAFLKKLQDIGFETIDAFADWIRSNASKSQKQKIHNNTYTY